MHSVLFRVDGNSQIGMGHIMRSITLAKELRKQNFNICFASKFEQGAEKIISEGFQLKQLSDIKSNIAPGLKYGSVGEQENEIEELNASIEQNEYDLLIVDSYNVSSRYFQSLKRFAGKIAYIDDINSFEYNADIIVNGNINATDLHYKKYNENQMLLLGRDYCLVREEFRLLPQRTLNTIVGEIMITTGGADPYNLSPLIAKAVISNKALSDIKVNIVIGKAFENKSELYKLCNRRKNIILHEGISNMSNIMLKCDLAISSGGSTLYELSACGTPTIAMILADNQKGIVEKMSEIGCVENIGWFNEISYIELMKRVDFYIRHYEARVLMSTKMQNLIDGLGAKRVANELKRTLEAYTYEK